MLEIRGLNKSYESDHGPVRAVRGIDFAIAKSEFYTLLGPSGCGKSTTLRCVAGLETPDSGSIRIGHTNVFDSSARVNVQGHRRDIAMVFQSYAIWPHMTVYDNVAFPLVSGRMRVPKREVRPRVREALQLVQLGALEDRPATDLSGGQQQRVAVARALVMEPEVLLLDEPLSNLDARLRDDMRNELRALTGRLGLTTLYVTHDQVEALTMSDRIAVMRDGLIVQEATAREIYSAPSDPFVAQFIGKINLIEATVVGTGSEGTVVDSPLGRLSCRLLPDIETGDDVLVAIRPERVVISATADGRSNEFPGKFESVAYLGDRLDCRVAVGDTLLQIQTDATAVWSSNDPVYVNLEPDVCVLFRVNRSDVTPPTRRK